MSRENPLYSFPDLEQDPINFKIVYCIFVKDKHKIEIYIYKAIYIYMAYIYKT